MKQLNGNQQLERTTLIPGDLVQLDPETTTNPAFAGCIMVVTEVKSWGVMGYVQAFGTRNEMGGQAYYRAGNNTFKRCGQAYWVTE